MSNFGILGGGLLHNLGSRSYVRSFFLAFERYPLSVELYRRLDWSLITDRLYRRIVPDDRLDEAIGTLARMLHLLDETQLADVDWSAIGLSGPEEGPAGLPADATLRDFYLPFEEGLVGCAAALKFGATRDWTFPSIRLACLSIPKFMEYEQRPVEEYEQLAGDPFWLRD